MTQARKRTINEPATRHVEVSWTACLLTRRDGGGEPIEFYSEDEAEQFNADPDGFAAKHFGFDDVDDYREWVACNGAPLCSERTKSGKPCNRQIGQNHGVEYWRQNHRMVPCPKHGGEPVNSGPMPPHAQTEPCIGYRRRRYPPPDHRRCEAITKPPDFWNGQAWAWGAHRCGMPGTYEREGKRVCHVHRDCTDIAFIDGGRS
jgi:hypothetical protein